MQISSVHEDETNENFNNCYNAVPILENKIKLTEK